MADNSNTAGNAAGSAARAAGRFIKRRKKLFIILTIVVIIAAIALSLVAGIGNSAAAATVPQTVQLTRGDLQQSVAGTGTLQSGTPREVTTSLSYEIAEVCVQEGDHVKEGQLLAMLDTAEIDEDIAEMRKNISDAEAKDALSLSQAERKLQDAINARDINWEKNEKAVQLAHNAIEAAREAAGVAAGNAAVENAALAAAQPYQAAVDTASANLTAAQNRLSTETAALAARQNEVDAINGGASPANYGYGSLQDAINARDAAQSVVDATTNEIENSTNGLMKIYNDAVAAYNAAYNHAKSNSGDAYNAAYTSGYNNANVSAQQTAYDTAVQTRDAQYRADSISVENARDSVNAARLQDSAASYRNQLKDLLKTKKDCRIEAPIGGTVTAMTAEVGQKASGSGAAVMAGTATSSGTSSSALFTIEDTARLEITSSIPEYDVVNIRVGMPVKITSDAVADGEWQGTVTHISAKAADSNGNFTVLVEMTTAPGALAIGMSAKINIITEAKTNVFAVPYDAVTTNSQGENVVYVYTPAAEGEAASTAQTTAEDGTGDAQPPSALGTPVVVQTGMETDYYIEITSDELEEGMFILSDPEGKNVNSGSTAGTADVMDRGLLGG